MTENLSLSGLQGYRVVETTKTNKADMLGSNDVSNDANSNRHANVTDVTQKAHGCRYSNRAGNFKIG